MIKSIPAKWSLKAFLVEREEAMMNDFLEMLRSELPRNGFTDVIVTEPEEWQRLDFVYLKVTGKYKRIPVTLEFSHSGYSVDCRDSKGELINQKSSQSIKGLAEQLEKALNPKKRAMEAVRSMS